MSKIFSQVSNPGAVLRKSSFLPLGMMLNHRTGLRLEVILREYMTRLERSRLTSPGLEQQNELVKPLNLIVVTDGGMSFICSFI